MSIFFSIHDGDDDYFTHTHHPDEVDALLSPFLEPRRKRRTPSSPKYINNNNNRLGELLSSLPDELLAEIFSWCCPSLSNQDPSLSFAALLLSQVSSRWRRITRSTPRLWTYTRLIVHERQITPAPLNLLRTWITYAGVLAVMIDIEFHERWQYPDSIPLLKLFKQLAWSVQQMRPDRVRSRCHEPDSNADVVTHIASGESGGFPWLEEWNFWSSEGYPSSRNGSPNHVKSPIEIRSSYRTSNLFIPSKYLSYADSLACLCMKGNNDYDWQHLGCKSVVDILTTFPSLLNLEVYLSQHADNHELWLPLPDDVPAGGRLSVNLVSFSLSFADALNIAPLLDVLAMPSLKELELDGFLTEPVQIWPHLSNFLEASTLASPEANPGISHLRLVNFDCYYIDLLGCVQHCSNTLEELELEGCILFDDVVCSIFDSYHPLRQLKSFNLLSCYEISLSDLISILQWARKLFPELQMYVNDCKICSREERDAAEQVPNLFLGPYYYVVEDYLGVS